MSRRRLLGAELLLPLAVIGAAALLIASETMTTFELVPAGGEALEALEAADRHDYALGILGVLAIAGVVVAAATGMRAAAIATAVAGFAALVIFLSVDLTKVGDVGQVDNPVVGLRVAEAEAQTGFWVAAFASSLLALAGAAYASLSPEQLRAPLDRFRRGEPDDRDRPAPATD